MPGDLPFIGRQRELGQVMSWADEAFAGEPRCVLIRGEAGIGKTRLLDEVAPRFATSARVLRGRCHEAVSIPYLPLSNALTPIITDWSSDRAASTPDSGQTDDRLSLFLRITEVIRSEVATQPVVFMLDDVQWADHASTDLLTHIVTTSVLDGARQPFPLLIVLGLRPAIGDPHVAGAVERFRREAFTRSVELGPLDRAELHELITSTVGTPPARTLLQDLITSSNGNPLMVSWLLQRLDDFGALKTRRGVLVNTTGSELVGLPAQLDELLRERSAGVSPRCRSLVITAALLGDDELIDDLEVVVGDETNFSKYFAEALDAGLLVDDGVRYRFSHPQLRQLHYHSPRGRRRRELHRQIADRLEAVHSADPKYALPIAFHLRMAADQGDPERLARYGVAAAMQAAAMGAWTDAWQLYEAVLATTREDSPFPSAFHALLHHRAAIAAWWAHDNASAQEHAGQAVDHSRALGDVERWGLAAVIAARASWASTPVGQPIDASETLTDFLESAEHAPPEVAARVHASLIQTRLRENQPDLARPHADAAWNLAMSVDDDKLVRDVEFDVGGLHFTLLDLHQAREWYQRAASRPAVEDDPLSTVWPAIRLGFVLWLLDELEEAQLRLAEGAALASRIGAIAEQALAEACLVAIAIAIGDVDQRDGRTPEALLLTRLSGFEPAGAVLYQALAADRADRGDRSGGHAALDAYEALAGRGSRRLRPLVDARSGDIAEARAGAAHIRPASMRRRQLGLWEVTGVAAELELAILLDDPEQARPAIEPLAEVRSRGMARGPGWPFVLDDLLATGRRLTDPPP